ncbi:hypothetical protein RJ640_010447 [Escallonia rubra]|uniref:TLC domain-containing protein n=1 Tax=Escallonia rubra TaxID=112253 RepID=A0AA88UNE5_9ASTE|nr:hypothetical protein RJ640_010447 [Escallonia rubra]
MKMGALDWEQESFPEYKDFVLVPLFALFFPSVRFFLDRFVFEVIALQSWFENLGKSCVNQNGLQAIYVLQKVGRRLIFGKGQQVVDVETDDRRKKIWKFKESAWKCVYYLSAELLALAVTYNEPWFTKTSYFWIGPGNQVWPEQKIKFARVGSVVLALHDASDVFLEVGKMSKYSGAEALASFTFILFVLSWILLRLTLKVTTNTKIDLNARFSGHHCLVRLKDSKSQLVMEEKES